MATHVRFEAGLKNTFPAAEQHPSVPHTGVKVPLQWRPPARPTSAGQEIESFAAARGMRRVLTREHGCALEMIGHAVDYLNDCYINEGPDHEVLDFNSPSMEAVRILISAQGQILRSLPLTEPFSVRIWNALWRRKSQIKSSGVVPLSSSR